jgi:hypothetical protein
MTCRDGLNPYGFVSLDSSIVSQQAYDVLLELDIPRSPPNLQAGNFMLDMVMLSPAYKPTIPLSSIPDLTISIRPSIPADVILYSSRRHAILTYHSELINIGKQLAGLPWYLLGWRRDAEKLEIKMAEGVLFSKGWKNVPTSVYLELQGQGQIIQVYDVHLKLRARFSGIRWLMYNHRIFSFVVFTTTFWAAEIFFTILAWILLNLRTKGTVLGTQIKAEVNAGSSTVKIEKDEDGALETDDLDLSDTPRSFPTYGRQAPLRYIPKFKKEDDSEEYVMDETATQPQTVEADDESEEPVDIGGSFKAGISDSGIGTSFSEGGSGLLSAAQRRRSRGGKA